MDTKQVLPHEVRPAIWDIARKMEEYWESDNSLLSIVEDIPMLVCGNLCVMC